VRAATVLLLLLLLLLLLPPLRHPLLPRSWYLRLCCWSCQGGDSSSCHGLSID
jgi:hypothetical protein